MWVIAVAIFLKTGPIFYGLPKQYVGEAECMETIDRFHEHWEPVKPAIAIGYKCRRILPING